MVSRMILTHAGAMRSIISRPTAIGSPAKPLLLVSRKAAVHQVGALECKIEHAAALLDAEAAPVHAGSQINRGTCQRRRLARAGRRDPARRFAASEEPLHDPFF